MQTRGVHERQVKVALGVSHVSGLYFIKVFFFLKLKNRISEFFLEVFFLKDEILNDRSNREHGVGGYILVVAAKGTNQELYGHVDL